MQIEVLKKYNKIKIIMLITIIVLSLTVILFSTSLAKYRNTNSINIAKGIVNYKPDTTPPVIGSAYATNVEKTSMSLYVTASDNKGITGYYFKRNNTSSWSSARCTGQSSCTFSVTGLTANTSYTYDVKVCDARNNCSTTTITQKTKVNDTTAPVIGSSYATNVEKTSMSLYVSATDDIGMGSYYFKRNNTSSWGTAKCTGKSSCIYSVTGLKANTSYTYDVKVCDTSNNCSTTTITQKTKIDDTTAPVIGSSYATNVEKSSMDLYVSATDNIGIAGYYFKRSTTSSWGTAKCSGQSSCTYSVTGLTANTSYTYDVKVCDTSNNCSTTTIIQKTKADGILASSIITGGTSTNNSIFSGTSGNGVYNWTKGDYSGGSQTIRYYRGNANNNWVVFGKDGSKYIWWRIIRNNSNGSLRMIYAGLSASKTSAPATTGTSTQIGTKAFNTNYQNNMYVGFKYTSGSVHGTGTASTILGSVTSTDATTLYGWYNAKLKTNYASYIDTNAGFCNDRQPSTSSSSLNGSGGTGTTETYYGAYIRLITNKVPTLLCNSTKDVFKTPVGLITADEVQMGGMVFYPTMNTNSYLYTGSVYWTMSPYDFSVGFANVFTVANLGCLDSYTINADAGVRPVVNLKADALFEQGGAGTSTNPYVVIGT